MPGPVLRLSAERCGNCKFQRQLPDTPYGEQPLCLRFPPLRAPIVLALPVQETPGGETKMQVSVRHEMTLSPAPDAWWCGEWKPRFMGAAGERVS